MRKTLNLVDQILSQGRRLHESGQYSQAAEMLQRLASFRKLPKSAAEETQSLLADIQFRQGRFSRARRHLKAALAHQPTSPDYHHRLALAVDEDPDGNAAQALTQFKRCLKLDPKNPHYWCDYAYAAINAGDVDRGIAALHKAHSVAPNDPEILHAVIHGLAAEGHEEEARGLVRAALFRNGGDYRFRALWNRFQFDALARRQEKNPPPPAAAPNKAVLLPFIPRQKELKLGSRTIRLDGPATLKGPHARKGIRASKKDLKN